MTEHATHTVDPEDELLTVEEAAALVRRLWRPCATGDTWEPARTVSESAVPFATGAATYWLG